MKKQTYELTNPQKSIWLTEQFYKGTSVNNICGTVNVTEKLNFDVLKDALNSVIKNNTNLLLNFEVKDGNLVQFVTDYKYFDIELIDVKTEADVEAIEKSMNDRVFEIENSYLFEFKMFRYPDSTGGFVFCCHHLIGDSWSLGLTGKACINTYLALCSKSDEVTSSNYIDFCESEKNYLSSSKFEKDKEYWNTVFTTVPEIASIPSKNKNINEKISCKANRNTYEFSQDLTSKINSFCKDNRISAFNFITAVYSLYISRVCNLKDFVVGTPILNRTNFVEKNTTGMFVSTVPLRINLEDKNSFLDLASNIAQNSMSMLRHQKYPYEYLLKDLRVKAPNLPNLYNFLISYQITKTTTEGLTYDTRWNFNGNSADELQLHILDINETGKLNLAYDYKTQKYTSHEIRDLHKRIEHIIDQILDNNEVLLNDIEIVTEEEKKELIFLKTKKDFKITKSIIEYIEDIAKNNPKKIAIEDENSSITYKQLVERINMTANFLLENYKFPEKSNIGVLTYRKIDTIISILSILKINCTFVPIDPEYPIDRIEYMATTAELTHILTSNFFDKKTNLDVQFINVNQEIIKNYSTSVNKKFAYNSNNILYIVFTSGSTGKPKGIMLKQSNMINLIFHELKASKMFNNLKDLKILQFATMSFDVSYQEIFTALLGSRNTSAYKRFR